MSVSAAQNIQYPLKQPRGLSNRISWLRDYYFKGTERAWNNEYTCWTTGTDWDVQFNEINFYIVPETYMLLQTILVRFVKISGNRGLASSHVLSPSENKNSV